MIYAESQSFQVFMAETNHLHPLTREQEADMGRKIEDGDQTAIDALVMHNIRFIVMVAIPLARQYGATLDDLVQAGVIGAVTAARRFDYRRKIKFISFAHLYVKQQMQAAITRDQWAVKVPDNTLGAMKRVTAVLEDMRLDGDDNPNPRDVARAAGIHAAYAAGVMTARHSTISLEDGVKKIDGDGMSLKDLIYASNERPDAAAEVSDTKKKITRLLSGLKPRNSMVLDLRFGLTDGIPMTLDAVGVVMGISRERVRQLERDALEDIRAFKDPALVDDLGASIGMDRDDSRRIRKAARAGITARRVTHARGRIGRGEYGRTVTP